MSDTGVNRRSLLLGLTAALAMPAIVKADSLMKIAVLRDSVEAHHLLPEVWAPVGRYSRQLWFVGCSGQMLSVSRPEGDLWSVGRKVYDGDDGQILTLPFEPDNIYDDIGQLIIPRHQAATP